MVEGGTRLAAGVGACHTLGELRFAEISAHYSHELNSAEHVRGIWPIDGDGYMAETKFI